MKLVCITLSILIFNSVYSISVRNNYWKDKRFEELGIEMMIPSNWAIFTDTDRSVAFKIENSSSVFGFHKNKIPGYESAENFMYLSDKELSSFIDVAKVWIEEGFFEYYFTYKRDEFIDIKGRKYLHIEYTAELENIFSSNENYSHLPRNMYEDVYIMLHRGYFYDFYTYNNETKISVNEHRITRHIVQNIKIIKKGCENNE